MTNKTFVCNQKYYISTYLYVVFAMFIERACIAREKLACAQSQQKRVYLLMKSWKGMY